MVRLAALTALSNVLLGASAFSVTGHYHTSSSKPQLLSTSVHYDYEDTCNSAAVPSIESSRRKALAQAAASILAGASTLGFSPRQALAADKTDTDEGGMVSQAKLASLLKKIPTFAIVDSDGVPYFVVGEDAKLTSYFFTSYGEAKRILDVAISSSDKAIKETKKEIKAKRGKVTKEDEEEIGINPWKSARITSVPLDLAVSLASKGKLAGAYFRVAPSESDIEDALAMDGTDDLPEGKVPLFYVEDMIISNGDEQISPLYFQKEQLIAEWQRQQKKEDKSADASKPSIKVTELFATITEMISPGVTDTELKTLQFVPPSDSKAKADKVLKGEKEPFKLGERLIVL